MTSPPHQLSVLMPAYNEERTVETAIMRVLALGEIVKEVIVVDDGSTDDTGHIVKAVARFETRVKVLQFDRNRGKTAAISVAIAAATGSIAVIQDSDLEYDPMEIPELIRPIVEGMADVVYGSRFLVRRAARVHYFYHYCGNVALTLLSNLLTNKNMSDIETGYKAFRLPLIQLLELSSRGFGLEVEITALICKTKARTYEVPISYYGRTYDEGKKIGAIDGVFALFYILYFNLLNPWLPSGRRFVQRANRYLATLDSVVFAEPSRKRRQIAAPVPA